jgi:N-acetylmuramoyl-L-alanine amidase
MLIQNFIPESQYSTKCPYPMTPKGICIHNTANDASTIQERNNVARTTNTAEVSFHIAIDDKEAIQLIPFNRNAWHAGDGGAGQGSRNYIAIEICYSLSGGERFINSEKRAAKEVAALLKQYNWTIASVKKHQDFSGKYCPHRTLNDGWQRFLNMIQGELDNLNGKTTITTGVLYRVRKSWEDSKSQLGAYSDLGNAKKECAENKGYSVFDSKGNKVYPVEVVVEPSTNIAKESEIKRYSETGKCTIDVKEGIYFYNNPYVSAIAGLYEYNDSVYYDLVVITNKYVYISWISASTGVRRYMPVFDKVNNERWGICI